MPSRRSGLTTGLILPFMLATGCIVIAAGSQFHDLAGEGMGRIIFGVGVLGMALSTIIILMLINGFCVCEALGLVGFLARQRTPIAGRGHRWVGLLLAGMVGVGCPRDGVLAVESAEPLAAQAVTADPLAALASLPYRPEKAVSGRLRVAGSSTLEQAAALWCAGFHELHPGVACGVETVGSQEGWRRLLAGESDVALVSRPLTEQELEMMAGQAAGRRIVVVTAAFDELAWIVHESNPVQGLVWSPDSGMLRVAKATVADPLPAIASHWGELTDQAGWDDVPIRLHGKQLGSGTRWHLDRLTTGTTPCPLDVIEHDSTLAVAEAVAADRGGLGILSNRGVWPGVRSLQVTIPADVPWPRVVEGSERPPTFRPLLVAVAVPDDGPWPDVLREFIEYILSFSGQLDAAKDGLCPLTRAELHAQRELLGWPVER
jgi:ABC-type phosphate transport system substrate-binding protein